MVKRAAWLSITPEPERELPAAVATLARGRQAAAPEVDAERARVQRLVLRGGQRRWLAYLHRAVDLICERRGASDADVRAAWGRARTVIINHHNLLLGLPGPGGRLTAGDRARLAALRDDEDGRLAAA
jgi:hypothetical protein